MSRRRIDLAAVSDPVIARADGTFLGLLALADTPRPAIRELFARLASLGIRRTVMLTGDNEQVAKAVAASVGITDVRAGLLPEDKLKVIDELMRDRQMVAMVGDGVNDAPALARASVGIAMGGIGSDAAMESADIVLMGDDLGALPYAIGLAQRARTVVIQNLVIATGVMLLQVTWVFAGQYTPLGALKLPVAVSGHEGSTVVVILNGLRLLRGRR